MTLLIMMLRKIANFTVVGVVDMINNELRDYIAEEHIAFGYYGENYQYELQAIKDILD